MGERFFVEHPITGDSTQMTGQEATHLVRVLRAQVGDSAILFDGSGREFQARISKIDKRSVEFSLLESIDCNRELPRRVDLAVALPKGDRQRILTEKLVELGASSLTPLITRFSVVQPDQQATIRLQRFVIEASKQCGRNLLMAVHAPLTLPDLLAAADAGPLRIIAHPRATTQPIPTADHSTKRLASDRGEWLSLPDLLVMRWQHLLVAIGPEGGFSPAEIELARESGWLPIDLGPRILRIETAAIAVATAAGLACQSTTRSPGTNA